MTSWALASLSVASVGVLLLPRRWASVPFILLACYIPTTQRLDFGSFSFTPLRALMIVAFARLLARRDWSGMALVSTDALMTIWAILLVATVAFHQNPDLQVVSRLGLALDGLGLYLVFRLFCRSRDDIILVCTALAILLVPLAIIMAYERVSAHNLLAFIGGVPAISQIRDGHIRAQGPFRHPILAGTVGALSVPLVAALWPTRRLIAAAGLASGVCIVVSATSSGPLMSLAVALGSLALWPLRSRVGLAPWLGVGVYLLLAAVMNRPPYYLMARIDLTGGSTGWHRARLIQATLDHLSEWWMVGTDYTRHWMPTGVTWNPDQTDLTNHYIALGVLGGLPLLMTFLAVMGASFRRAGQCLRANSEAATSAAFLSWAIGSALFTLAVTSVSIAYFDQSILWMYMTFAFCNALSDGDAATPEVRERTPDRTTALRWRSRRRFRRAVSPASRLTMRSSDSLVMRETRWGSSPTVGSISRSDSGAARSRGYGRTCD
jgi:hypothetical protein